MAHIEGETTRVEIEGTDISEYVERIKLGVNGFVRSRRGGLTRNIRSELSEAMAEFGLTVVEAGRALEGSLCAFFDSIDDSLDTSFHPGGPPSDDLNDLLDRIAEGLREHRDSKSS